jgi:hypothetical protein
MSSRLVASSLLHFLSPNSLHLPRHRLLFIRPCHLTFITIHDHYELHHWHTTYSTSAITPVSSRPLTTSCISTLSVTRAFGFMSAHGRLTILVQFEVSTPHILYACLGGFVVFVCHPFRLLHSEHATNFSADSQFGMFSLFIREKVCD